MFVKPIITDKGLELLSKITTNTLTISNMGLGDGDNEVVGNVTSLRNEILKKEIETIEKNKNSIVARTTFTNESLQNGFYIREMGIYAIDPDEGEILYAYTNVNGTEADYFSPGNGTVILRVFIEMIIGFGNASNVELTIDPASVFITASMFDKLVDEVEKKANKEDIPTSLPANGGNADTVGDFTVESNVPAGAKFTDTVYTHPTTHPASMITGLPTNLPANGGNADTVGGKSPSAFANASHTHSKSEVGLGNVDNTADANKSVNYANGAGVSNTTNQLSVTSGAPASPFAGQLWIW